MAEKVYPVCAFCGKSGGKMIQFTVLAEACRQEGIWLIAESNYFHTNCARFAFDILPALAAARVACDDESWAGIVEKVRGAS